MRNSIIFNWRRPTQYFLVDVLSSNNIDITKIAYTNGVPLKGSRIGKPQVYGGGGGVV